jgi:hypothetical protein
MKDGYLYLATESVTGGDLTILRGNPPLPSALYLLQDRHQHRLRTAVFAFAQFDAS